MCCRSVEFLFFCFFSIWGQCCAIVCCGSVEVLNFVQDIWGQCLALLYSGSFLKLLDIWGQC